MLFQLALDEFKRSNPEHCNIHWDGKQITSCLGVVDECEAIMVSGSSSYIEGKNRFCPWDIKDNVRYMTYDTTSSNTGVNKGCCLRLEEWLNRPVMWYGCRHHIGELMAKAAWYTLFEEDLQPTVFFTTLKHLGTK